MPCEHASWKDAQPFGSGTRCSRSLHCSPALKICATAISKALHYKKGSYQFKHYCASWYLELKRPSHL
jgi:hypothetical protein